jgi:hypothetical protein
MNAGAGLAVIVVIVFIEHYQSDVKLYFAAPQENYTPIAKDVEKSVAVQKWRPIEASTALAKTRIFCDAPNRRYGLTAAVL